MPTGYTYNVSDGTLTDLRTFALQCARGMGACVMLRDESTNTPIPERFEPSDYHSKALAEAVARESKLRAMSTPEREHVAKQEYTKRFADWHKRREENTVRRERYESMLAKVQAWDCRAEGLKSFMVNQLQSSLNFDCDERLDKWDPLPTKQTAEAWWTDALAQAQKDRVYHAEQQAAENERTEARNRWLAALRASLESVP